MDETSAAQGLWLVPDYFPSFRCKCGACRACCCSGWAVSISADEYFRLIGVDCSPELRRRLDRALHLLPNPTPDRCARLDPDWQGACSLQMPNGLCALQSECGEEVLPKVCRLYPRGLRSAFEREGSCANSCEAVVELFLHRQTPLTFVHCPPPAALPPIEPPVSLRTARRDRTVRDETVRLLQDRREPLQGRLGRFCAAMRAGADAECRDLTLEQCLEACRQASCRWTVAGLLSSAPDAHALRLLLVRELALEDPGNLGGFARAACRTLCGPDGRVLPQRWNAASAAFAAQFPFWPTLAEHLLVNHLFFNGFPGAAAGERLWDACAALCAAYALLRFAVVGCSAAAPEASAADPGDPVPPLAADPETRLTDVCAAVFRLVEHSNFDQTAPLLLRRAHAVTPAALYALAGD